MLSIEARILHIPVLAEEHFISWLLVSEFNSPGNLMVVVGGDLFDRLAFAVVRINAEASRLSFDSTELIFESSNGIWRMPRSFGTDEIFVWAVANSSDAESRMDFAIRNIIKVVAQGLFSVSVFLSAFLR